MLMSFVEIVLAFLSFYILYRSADKVQNFMFFLFGLSMLSHSVCLMLNLAVWSNYTLWMEHLFVQVVIAARFVQIVFKKNSEITNSTI